MSDVSTHVLVPAQLLNALRELALRTRIHQSEYLREAVADVLVKHQASPAPTAPIPAGRLVSVVFRVARERLDELELLSRRTRVRRSEFLREAIHDVLQKHHALPSSSEPTT